MASHQAYIPINQNDPFPHIPIAPKYNTFEDRFKNIKRVGITHHRLSDTYYWLVNLKWVFLFVVVLIFYMFVATVFAIGYYIFRHHFDPELSDFGDCFFLAIGIITSQGSGAFVARSIVTRFIILVESVCGMVILALLTGLIYSKFSKPTPRISFSKVLVLTTVNGQKALQFRAANERDNFCNNVSVTMAVFLAEITAEGTRMRRLHDLPLSRKKIPVFAMSHLAHHVIDEHSPLHGMSLNDLADHKAEFFVQMFGTDAGYDQLVHKNHVYSVRDIVPNHRFNDMISFGAEGTAIMDIRKLSDSSPLVTAH